MSLDYYRRCQYGDCDNELPEGCRADRRFCSNACRQAYYRAARRLDAVLATDLDAILAAHGIVPGVTASRNA